MNRVYKDYIIEEHNNRLMIKYKILKKSFYIISTLLIFQNIFGLLEIYYTAVENENLEKMLGLIVSVGVFLTVGTMVGIYFLAWAMLAKKELLLNRNHLIYSRTLKRKDKIKTYEWDEIKEFQLKKDKSNYTVHLVTFKKKEYPISNAIEEIEAQRLAFKLNAYRMHLIPSIYGQVA